MQKEHPLPQILPLNEQELIIISVYSPTAYPAPPHYHTEYELILTVGEKLYRTIGDTAHLTNETELILLGPNLYHKWEKHLPSDNKSRIVSINFNRNFLHHLTKGEYSRIQQMLEKSAQGLLFPAQVADMVKERLQNLINLKKKASLKELSAILTIIAENNDYYILCNSSKSAIAMAHDAIMENLTAYLKKNYSKKLSLQNMSHYTGKSITSFNRFIRKQTGTTFTDYLNTIRISFAARKLTETTENVATIAEFSGFNNLAYFNRTFKKKWGITPLRYRETFYGSKKII